MEAKQMTAERLAEIADQLKTAQRIDVGRKLIEERYMRQVPELLAHIAWQENVIARLRNQPTEEEKQKRYRCTQPFGYRLLIGNREPIDPTADYRIDCYSPAAENRPVIVRCDGEEYHGESRWIVEMHNLVEITGGGQE